MEKSRTGMIGSIKRWEQMTRRRIANAFWSLLGYRAYRHFVIIGHERTGSSMLVSCLNAHPHIECHGEIFKRLDGRRLQSLARLYFGPKPRRIRAAGCKIFYSHPQDGDHNELLDLIKSWPAPLIIHLTRTDALRTLTSLRIAESTAVWGLHTSGSPLPLEQRKVHLPPEEVRNFITHIRHEENRIASTFSPFDYLHITYEALSGQPDEVLRLIFSRLGVEDFQVSTPYKKMNPEPLESLILNFEELRQAGLA